MSSISSNSTKQFTVHAARPLRRMLAATLLMVSLSHCADTDASGFEDAEASAELDVTALSDGAPASSAVRAATDKAWAALEDQLSRVRAELSKRGSDLKLVRYQEIKGLSTAADVTAFNARALSGSQVVPTSDAADATRIRLASIDELSPKVSAQATASAGGASVSAVADVRAGIQTLGLSQVKAGQRVARIHWQTPERGAFTTECAFDAKGFAYDSILTNYAFVEPLEGPNASQKSTAAAADTVSASAVSASSRSHQESTFLTATMKWITGQTRGRATVTHGVLIDSKKGYVDQTCSHGDTMSIGKSGSDCRKVSLSSRTAKVAGGVYLATPTVGIKMSYNTKSAKFEFSINGVGSKVYGSSDHVFYF